MYQLQKAGLIDHQVIMINSNGDDDEANPDSYIKFGSWDESALAYDESLYTLKTKDNVSWTIRADKFYLGGEEFVSGNNKDMDFSPHLPYLYLPNGDWTHFAFRMGENFEDIDCSYTGNYCRFLSSCSEVKQKSIPMSFLLYDDDTEYKMETDLQDMFVDGDNFGEESGRFCYAPVFMSKHSGTKNTWFVGSLFLRKYVMVLDNTPYDERDENFNTVSFGIKDTSNIRKELNKQYNRDSSLYAPSEYDTTTSIHEVVAPSKPEKKPDNEKTEEVIPDRTDETGDGDSNADGDADADKSDTADHGHESYEEDKTKADDGGVPFARPGRRSRSYVDPNGEIAEPPFGFTPEYIIYMIGKLLTMTGSFTSILSSI